MKRGLFVGARVRILWSRRWPELAGKEGRITDQLDPGTVSSVTKVPIHWRVTPDAWGSEECPYDRGHCFAPHSDQLEAIQPEGAQPCGECFEKVMQDLTQLTNEVTA